MDGIILIISECGPYWGIWLGGEGERQRVIQYYKPTNYKGLNYDGSLTWNIVIEIFRSYELQIIYYQVWLNAKLGVRICA